MVTLDLSRVDRKVQDPSKLVSYLFPFGSIPSHILKPNWNGPRSVVSQSVMCVCSRGNEKVSNTHIQTISFNFSTISKFCMFLL